MWFQNRRTKNRRTVDEERSAQLEPGHTVSESSDDSCGDTESQDNSCTTTTTAAVPVATTRISPESARFGRDVDHKRHVTAMTSRGDDVEGVYIDDHVAGVSGGWTDLCRSHTMRHRLSPSISKCPAAVTIGQS